MAAVSITPSAHSSSSSSSSSIAPYPRWIGRGPPRTEWRTSPCSSLSSSYSTTQNPLLPITQEQTPTSYSILVDQNQKADVNAKIRRLCKTGDLKGAVETIIRQAGRAQLHEASYCSVLQLCGELEALPEGLMSLLPIHSSSSSSSLGLKLVFMHVRCGDLASARKVFDQMPNRDYPLIWNLMMNGYLKAGELEQVLALFHLMRRSHVDLNPHVFSCVLKCLGVDKKMGEQLHGLLVRSGLLHSSVAVANALIAFYCRSGGVVAAMDLFDEMPQTQRDVITWNTMMHGCIANGLLCEGLERFRLMCSSGIAMDSTTFISILPACARMGMLPLGKAIHGTSTKLGYGDDVALSNSLLDMYSRCRDLSGAARLFNRIDFRDAALWTTMISRQTQAMKFEEPIKLLQRMESEGIQMDAFVITSILHACAAIGCLEKGLHALCYVIKKGYEIDVYIANALVDMYAKCGCIKDARATFDRMADRDVTSWCIMISGYTRNHLADEAISLFREMVLHVRPTVITLSCVLSAAADLLSIKRGKEIHGYILRAGCFSEGPIANALIDMYTKCSALSLARQIFDRIAAKDLISWTAMIVGYCMHGNGKEAISLFKKMRRTKLEPDEVLFITILRACSHSRLVVEGWIFFDIMRNDFSMDPKLDHYICMVDLLSQAGHLSKAYKFIRSMPITPDSRVWAALLYGCKIHKDAKLAEVAAECIFALEPGNTKYYVLLADIYAEVEKSENAKKIREKRSRKSPRKNARQKEMKIRDSTHISENANKQRKKMSRTLLRKNSRHKEMQRRDPTHISLGGRKSKMLDKHEKVNW